MKEWRYNLKEISLIVWILCMTILIINISHKLVRYKSPVSVPIEPIKWGVDEKDADVDVGELWVDKSDENTIKKRVK